MTAVDNCSLANCKEVEVSVVLPAKDEEKTIGICIDKIKKVFEEGGISGEIIVSDSSQDRTPVIAKEHGAMVVTPDRKGYGYAYIYAFRYIKGKYVVMGDADDTYDFLEMPKLLEPLKNREADLVIGSRFKGKIEKGAMPWHHRWIGNPILTWFLNLFFKAGISDAHSGFRVIEKNALEKLNLDSEGMEFASEMIMEATLKGLRIKEVPISYYGRKNNNSKLSSFSDGWRHLRFMLINAPNFLFLYPGIFLLLLGIFLLCSTFFNFIIEYVPEIYSTIAGSLLIISGYQIIFFSLFAKIVQGKSVPPFLTIERGVLLGVSFVVCGLAYILYFFFEFMKLGDELIYLKMIILGFVFIFLGIQTFFSSFMLSAIAEKRRMAIVHFSLTNNPSLDY
ncbi:MAG: glycosyltransferase [Candidatus Jordarchaeaceae archaeon]